MKKVDLAIKATALIIVGMLIGTLGTTYKYKRVQENYAFLKEANAFKYEMLMAADDYIVNSQKLFDKLDAETSFADTYGELETYDSICRAYEVYDSLIMTQL